MTASISPCTNASIQNPCKRGKSYSAATRTRPEGRHDMTVSKDYYKLKGIGGRKINTRCDQVR
ncbi:hypothetical protein FFI87_001795 [Burkholderia sp. KBS0801]|nr:hypothetical protein FFI87_001795 [Burkholderia sp. KBS0801]